MLRPGALPCSVGSQAESDILQGSHFWMPQTQVGSGVILPGAQRLGKSEHMRMGWAVLRARVFLASRAAQEGHSGSETLLIYVPFLTARRAISKTTATGECLIFSFSSLRSTVPTTLSLA